MVWICKTRESRRAWCDTDQPLTAFNSTNPDSTCAVATWLNERGNLKGSRFSANAAFLCLNRAILQKQHEQSRCWPMDFHLSNQSKSYPIWKTCCCSPVSVWVFPISGGEKDTNLFWSSPMARTSKSPNMRWASPLQSVLPLCRVNLKAPWLFGAANFVNLCFCFIERVPKRNWKRLSQWTWRKMVHTRLEHVQIWAHTHTRKCN